MKRFLGIILTMILLSGCIGAFAEDTAWTCPDCGAACTTNFCMQCGAKKPETIVCPDCGKEYPADLDASFCGDCGARLKQDIVPPGRMEGNGFDTPEEAVTYYLEGLKNLDFKQILRAFAWETQAEHFSVEAMLKRIKSYSVTNKPRFPSDSVFLRDADMYSILSYEIDKINQSIDMYCLGKSEYYPEYKEKYRISFKEDAEVKAFLDQYDNGSLEKLAGLTNIRFLTPDDVTNGMFSNEHNQKSYLESNAKYGADETVDLPAVADIDGGEILFCCPTIARYGSKWYLVSVSSMTSLIRGIPYDQHAFLCMEKTAFEQEYLKR